MLKENLVSNIPVQVENLISNLLDTTNSDHIRYNYRQTLASTKEAIDRAISIYDKESWNNPKKKRSR